MSLVAEQAAFAQDVAKLLQQAVALGYEVTFGEAYRTAEQQEWYVERGLSKTKDSYHLKRLAVDLNIFKDGELIDRPADLGAFWEGLNPLNHWGGNFTSIKDYDHFERTVT